MLFLCPKAFQGPALVTPRLMHTQLDGIQEKITVPAFSNRLLGIVKRINIA